jgi:hypothetical protein
MDRVLPPLTGQIGSETGANTSITNNLASGLGQSNQSSYTRFGEALRQMLMKYQGLGTQKFQNAGYQAQTEQANRVMAQATPGMPPALQQQVRNASVQAEQPNVSGAEGLRKSFSEQISGLGDAISQAQSIGQWMQQQEENTKKEARDLVLKNTDAVKAMPDKERNELLKKAEISQSFLDSMPSQGTTAKTEIVEAGGRKLLINMMTGDTIKDLGSAPLSTSQQTQETANKAEAEKAQLALSTAQELMQKVQSGYGMAAVGGVSSFLGNIPGTKGYEFKNQFDKLKALLSLDMAKYLKGSGQISDAERQMLANAATDLSRGMSEQAFKAKLQDVINVLNKGLYEEIEI